MPVVVNVTMSSEHLQFSVSLDSLLSLIAGAMIVITVFLLSILVICLRTICEDSKSDNSPTIPPPPPPMPTTRQITTTTRVQETTTLPTPAWVEEIQENKMFSRIRIELARNSMAGDREGDHTQELDQNTEPFCNFVPGISVI